MFGVAPSWSRCVVLGVITDEAVIPDPDALTQALEDELDALCADHLGDSGEEPEADADPG